MITLSNSVLDAQFAFEAFVLRVAHAYNRKSHLVGRSKSSSKYGRYRPQKFISATLRTKRIVNSI